MPSFSTQEFERVPITGILRGYTETQVLKTAEAYASAGFTTLEITLNTPAAISLIETVQRRFEGSLQVGAGTVLTRQAVDAVAQAGGQFIVSPVVDVALMAHCQGKGLPVFPGAYSPTEIYQAWQAGAYMVKVFPARNLGPAYIKDVLAPLHTIKLMPTGGVTQENMAAYWQAGAQAFGMGGSLFNKALIQANNWKGLLASLVALRQHLEYIRHGN